MELSDRFVDLACLTYCGNDSRARRDEASSLLAANPDLVHASVHAAAAAADVDALRTHLDRDRRCAGQSGPPRGWVPLLSLCYSRVARPDALACLDLLLAASADPDAYTLIGDSRFTALTGVLGEGESGPFEQPPHPQARAMAERLLDAGADPDDAQGIYNTHFLPSNAWLDLLFARGLSSAAELEFLLSQAAGHGFVERVQLLLAHGTPVDGRSRYNGRTHLEYALLEGHVEIAGILRAAGSPAPALSDGERFHVAVASYAEQEARRILAASPSANDDPAGLLAAARHGRLDALKLGLALGLPIDGHDRQGLTALHHAARRGHLDIVRELVARGASVVVRDPVYDGTALGHARHFTARWPRPDGAAIVAFLESQTR
jgi:ankyrin repeat protein